MRKVLIIGFSCTELSDGYAAALSEMLTERFIGIQIFRCGLGGLNPHVIPSAIEKLNQTHGPFTHVILEVSTSIYAWNTRDSFDLAADLAVDIAYKASISGARTAILLLYRHEKQPALVPWNDILRDLAVREGYPIVDLAEGFIKDRGIDYALSLLRDVTHTTKEGSRIQAELILNALAGWLTDTSPGKVSRNSIVNRSSVSFADLTGAASQLFRRLDATFPYIELAAGESIRIDFPKPVLTNGITFVYGPWGGRVSMSVDDEEPIYFDCIDDRSYYERLGLRYFNPRDGRNVTRIELKQENFRPAVSLLRGEVDSEPPKARLVSILTLSPHELPRVAPAAS